MSQALIIKPHPIAEADIVSTNLVDSVPLWSSQVSYPLGAEIRVPSTRRILVSKVKNNLNHDPSTDEGKAFWIDKGPVNTLAMYDAVNGTRSVGDGLIRTVIKTEGWRNSLALDALTASRVTISAISGAAPRTNYLRYSDEVDRSVWLKSLINPVGSPVRKAPDGTMTAQLFSGGSFGRHYAEQTVQGAPAGTWTLSWEVRAASSTGSSRGYLYLNDGNRMVLITFETRVGPGSYVSGARIGNWQTNDFVDQSSGAWEGLTYGTVQLEDGWVRVWLTVKRNATGNLTAAIGLRDGASEFVTEIPDALYLGIGQLENGPLSPTIRTAADPTTIAGDEVYRQTHDLLDDSAINDIWDHFYEPLAYKPDLVLTDIPMVADMVFTTEISGTGAVACGTQILGMSQEIGAAVLGSRVGISDYSIKEIDEFGSYFLTERGFAKRGTFSMFAPRARVDALYNLFAKYRSTPVVWVMGSASRARIFGIYKSFEFVFAHPEWDEYDLVIEGLT